MPSAAQRLLRALRPLGGSNFFVAGRVDPVLPGLEVRGAGTIGLPVGPRDSKALIACATQAPYGRGEETVVDTDVRRVWQIDAADVSFESPKWSALIDGIVETVKRDFRIKGGVQCDLHKLLVYGKGSFFAPHRDSEKTDTMFATLVVCLPSRHRGGKLVVRHDGRTEAVAFGDAPPDGSIGFAAFYTDCEHEIERVTSGHRVCLVYNLSVKRRKRQPSAPRSGASGEEVRRLLDAVFEGESSEKLAIPLEHRYTPAGLGWDRLKGADRARAAALLEATREGYAVYLALLDAYVMGEADCGSFGYAQRHWEWELDEASAEIAEVHEESIALKKLTPAPGRRKGAKLPSLVLEKHEVLWDRPFEKLPFRQEVTEATGNEGVTVERWYSEAVIVLWPETRGFRVLAKEGPHVAVPALRRFVRETKKPAESVACRAFAGSIIDEWSTSYHCAVDHGTEDRIGTVSKRPSKSAAMLRVLETLDDAELVGRFLGGGFVDDFEGDEGALLARVAERVDWRPLATGLAAFAADPTRLADRAAVFEGFCRAPVEMTAERVAVLDRFAASLEKTIRRVDEGEVERWRFGSRGDDDARARMVASMIRALEAIGDIERLDAFLTRALADERDARYSLHDVLVPAAVALAADGKGTDAHRRLLDHVIAALEARTKTRPTPPKDWTREADLRCNCKLCAELATFLRDPTAREHRFPLAKEKRRHLHQKIAGRKCDLDHVTERRGRPFTLVCTKNRASYERRKTQFASDKALLREMRRASSGTRKSSSR